MVKAKGFTLVEILVVVVLLGILAAIVIPVIANSSTAAKQSALAVDLQLLRRVVLVYKYQHLLEVGPGYPNGQSSGAPTEQAFVDQATLSSNNGGQTAPVGTPGFSRGPYLSKIPVNPFSGKDSIQMLGNGEDFPANADDSHGWIYKAATSEIRPDNTGTDDSGKRYYDY